MQVKLKKVRASQSRTRMAWWGGAGLGWKQVLYCGEAQGPFYGAGTSPESE